MAEEEPRQHPRIDLAIPVFNEEPVLPELLARIGKTLAAIPGGPHRAILVDDGSSDRTLEILRSSRLEGAVLKVASLSRNFGHQAAISAALDQVDADVVIVMDADLQDPPEAIHQFLEAYEEGYDVVYAKRVKRKESWLLRAAYYLFYRVAARLSEVTLPLDAGDFALLSRRVVDELRRSQETHRFLRGLRAFVGFRQTGIEIERAERFAGKTKYSALALVRLASDGIFSFSIVPLRLAALTGLLGACASVTYAVYAIVARILFDSAPRGFTTLIAAILFLASLQMLFLGVIGEYVGRIYNEVKRRPLYVLESVTEVR